MAVERRAFARMRDNQEAPIKPLGDMPATSALGRVVVTHGMMHFGQMELVKAVVGAKPVVSV